MISRYAIKEIDLLCSDTEKLKRWAQVELAIIYGLHKHKIITKKEFHELTSNLKWNLELTKKHEEEVKHDVFAFIMTLNELTKTKANKWIHYGVTSTDIVDTANGLLYQEINKLILKDLVVLINLIKKLAIKHENTIMLARTHGQSAEPTTLGLKFINWFDQLNRNKENFINATKLVEVGKISGAVGTHAHLPNLKFEKDVCKYLNLNAASTSTQVLSRDRHAQYFNSLILLISSISSFAHEIRLLALDDVNELSEGFEKNQKGSSAMPQKRNPISCENICGLARVIQGYSTTVYENITLWHERDISHSSTERILNQDFISLVLYIIRRFIKILDNLIVNKDQMIINLNKSTPKIYSQTIMLYLIKKHNLPRLEAYEIIKKLSSESLNLNELIERINEKISKPINLNDIKIYLRPTYHTRYLKDIIKSTINFWNK
ncbi:adenylosuccinate lyase [Mycoplasmoides pirum]|uniref:adenylosuccinate lyase n=1 Tax=Mycoplasmoides pirum TaxID=2122 RepID=UPI000488A8F5|nr:adenylosuccinate lyase [Mycoplasmoides pirum]